MTAHTQGEARVCTLEIADGDCVVMIGDRQILECYEDGEVQNDEDRANAQRVVKTWNAYSKFVEAITEHLAAGAAADKANDDELGPALERVTRAHEAIQAILRDLGEASS